MKTSLSIPLAVLSAAVLAGCGTPRVVATTPVPATVVVTPPVITGAAVVTPAPVVTRPAVVARGPVVASTTVVTPAPVASTAVAGAPPAVRLPAADVQFVAVAAGAGMYEAEAARMALTSASDAQVRSFAQMLFDHHKAGNGELAKLLAGKGHRLAPGLPAALQQKIDTLARLDGAAFDREFVRMTGVEDHRAAIAAFEQGQRGVADADLKAFIDRSLPVLRSHLQQAQDLAGRMAG